MSKKMFLGVALFMAAWFVACGDDDDSVGVNEPSVPQSSAETASSSETVYSSEAISEYSSSEILPLSSSIQEILESSSSIEVPLSSFEGVSSSLVLSSLSEKISSSSAKYTYSSSSVPAAKADSIIWKSRGKETIVRRYDDDSSAIQKAGRFWIVKESTMNGKETDLLKQFGINGRLSVATYNDEIRLVLCTSENDVRKKLLDSLLYGFFNSFTADDTTKLEVKFEEDDWYKKRSVCLNFHCF